MATCSNRKSAGLAAAIFICMQFATAAQAQYPYQGYASHIRCGWDQWKYQHPKVKTAAVDGAIGTAAGAVVGAISGRGALHGALVGAASGAGIGLVRSSATMAVHPVAKTVSEVGIAGLGLYLAAHHGHEL